MILTIAMVVYNEEKRLALIRSNLEFIQKHSEQVNVLIIDNASTDSTATQLTSLQNVLSFRLIRRSQNNMGAARAEACLLCPTPWLAFLDADCVINERWLELVLEHTQRVASTVAAFGGPWIPAGPSAPLFTTLFKTFYGHFNMPQIKDVSGEHPVRHIPTACVVYRLQDVLDAGNFDAERSRVGEDLDMSYRLLSRRRELILMPQLGFAHHLPETLGCWFRKILTYGEARIRMALRHGDVMAMNYILPLVFFAFLILNLALWPLLKGLPVGVYLMTALISCFITEPSLKAFRVFLYMVGTHLAYASGMALGLLKLSYEKVCKRKRLDPISYKPQSVEKSV